MARIKLSEERLDVLWRLDFCQMNVNRRQDAAWNRQQVRGEDHTRFRQAGVFQDFRRVPMGEQVVGAKVSIHFHELQVTARLLARTAGSGFAIANDRMSGGQESSLLQGPHGKNDAGGITTGIGDQLCGLDSLGVKLRQAIDRFAKTRSVRRGQLVPGSVGLGGSEAEGSAQINHAQPGVQEFRSEFSGYLMRRGQKGSSGGAAGNGFQRERLQRSLTPAAQLGKHFRKAMRPVGFSYIKSRLGNARMAQEQRRQLKTRIAGDTNDRNVAGISHFTWASIFFCRESRVLRLGVMIRTVSSPAMVPAISGNFAASTAAARGCAPLGGVFSTSRFSAGRMSRRNSRSARVSGATPADSSGNAVPVL